MTKQFILLPEHNPYDVELTVCFCNKLSLVNRVLLYGFVDDYRNTSELKKI